jgi:hypothetical protein
LVTTVCNSGIRSGYAQPRQRISQGLPHSRGVMSNFMMRRGERIVNA